MTDEKIARINALAKKAKTEGLTDAEKKEQQALRAEYVADFRKELEGTAGQHAALVAPPMVKIVEPSSSKTSPRVRRVINPDGSSYKLKQDKK